MLRLIMPPMHGNWKGTFSAISNSSRYLRRRASVESVLDYLNELESAGRRTNTVRTALRWFFKSDSMQTGTFGAEAKKEGLPEDIRTVQELLGHADVSTTMIYTHVLNHPGVSVQSPLDRETR